MGCCVSTNRGSSTEKESHLQLGIEPFHQKPVLESRAPPPSAEEETVKEVWSETPKPKAPIFMIPRKEEEEEKKTQQQIEKLAPAFVEIQEKESLCFNNIIKKTEPKSPAVEESASEDVSEICSVSLSESVSTVTDRRDEEDEVRQQKVFRSPARPGSSRNRVVGRSPTRKLDQSPGRRNGVVAIGGNGGSSSFSSVRRGRPDPPRKDPGESSGRRSRSPAVNRSVMGQSPSGKRTNQSPGRVRRDPPPQRGNSKKVGHQQQKLHGSPATTMEGKWPSCSSTTANGAAAATSSANESLENPLVSLECFIFL